MFVTQKESFQKSVNSPVTECTFFERNILAFSGITLYFFEQKHGISTEENCLTYVMRIKPDCANSLKKKLKSAGKNSFFLVRGCVQ